MAKVQAKAVSEPSVVRKAFTIERGAGGWRFVTITYDDAGNKLSVEKSEPDLKALAIERFKIAGFKYWSTLG